MDTFLTGDLVCHNSLGDDGDDKLIGTVTGFCPGVRWVRVRTMDGRNRIWLKANVHNVDYTTKEGNYAEHGID